MRNTAMFAFISFLCAAPIFAEPDTEPVPEQTPVPPISRHPAPRPAGFHKSALIFSLMGGPTLRASNSFMNQEKAYDRNLNLQVQAGNIPIAFGNTSYSGPLYTSRYRMLPIIQFDYERAISDHFSLGFSIFNFSIDGTRQDVRPGFRSVAPNTMVRQDYVLPYPTDSKLFMSTGGMLQAVYHPLSTTFLDPYIALRGGIEGHAGNAHTEAYPDPIRYDNRIRNGVGFATGAALGLNLYMSRYFGFKFEATGLRQFLKSDTYSARTMDSAHFQIGIFVSLF